jgi:hypothetical protein
MHIGQIPGRLTREGCRRPGSPDFNQLSNLVTGDQATLIGSADAGINGRSGFLVENKFFIGGNETVGDQGIELSGLQHSSSVIDLVSLHAMTTSPFISSVF